MERLMGAVGLALAWLVWPTAAGADAVAGDFAAEPFRSHWFDGRAEVSGWSLRYPRYGELREGTAVTVFVTEPFNVAKHVKSDTDAGPDIVQAMKMILVQDFPTGVYDYHLQTSAFSLLAPANGYDAGGLSKVSFSAQEWCGHVFAQVTFGAEALQLTSLSYFEQEGDVRESLPRGEWALSEDALLLWARGMCGPRVEPGRSAKVKLLRSLEHARTRHVPVQWDDATLSVAAKPQSVTVPAGTFEALAYTADVAGRVWTIHVEAAFPHRVLQWTCSDGREAKLLGIERMPYWQMNADRFRDAVTKLGLQPRGELMP